jgi:hypothetical protein
LPPRDVLPRFEEESRQEARMISQRLTWAALVAALGFSGLAPGQTQFTPPRPDQGGAVSVRGNVKQFTAGPSGEIDGLLLDNGQQVQFPSMVALQAVNMGLLGHDVQVVGTRASGQGPLIQANVISDVATGGSLEVRPIAATRSGVGGSGTGGSGNAGVTIGPEARVTASSPACQQATVQPQTPATRDQSATETPTPPRRPGSPPLPPLK